MIYLDNSATTQTFEEAAQVACQYMTQDFFNPSAMYTPAVETERAVNGARARLAQCMGAQGGEIIYTSGGTESDNMAILGTSAALRPGRWRFITTRFEHPAVYNVFMSLEQAGQEVLYLQPDSQGRISLEELRECMNENTALVSIMHVNNEIGSIQDLDAISALVRRINPHTVLHSDGVQAFGKLPFGRLPVDLYSISGHKFHGPKGVGALLLRDGVKNRGGQLGGGQEKGLRSGTTNVPGIMGMDAALNCIRASQPQMIAQMRDCKKRLAGNLSCIQGAMVNGPSVEEGAGHILNMSFAGVRAEVLLHALEEKGVYVATGSACSSHHRKGKNRVLESVGISGERAESAIRFSFSCMNTLEEMDLAAQAVWDCVALLRRFRRR
jgi:cysteine desulfurase